MSGISLTASMRSNLLSLQNIASQQDIVQNRLATGLKVSSAIDNPSSYYTASSLNNRAADLTALLDSMSQGIQTIKAASEAIVSGTKFLEQAKAVANQALGTSAVKLDKSWFAGQAGENGAVVETAQELVDAVNAGKEMIVVYGKIEFATNDNIVLQANQKLVGTEYFADKNINALYRDSDGLRFSRLSFSMTTATSGVVMENGALVSDLNIDYINTDNTRTNAGAVYLNGNGKTARISNLDIQLKTSDTAAWGKVAVWAYSGAELNVEGNLNISSEGRRAYGLYSYNGAKVNLKNGSKVNIMTQSMYSYGVQSIGLNAEFNVEKGAKLYIQTLGANAVGIFNDSAGICNVAGEVSFKLGSAAAFNSAGVNSKINIAASARIWTEQYVSETILWGNDNNSVNIASDALIGGSVLGTSFSLQAVQNYSTGKEAVTAEILMGNPAFISVSQGVVQPDWDDIFPDDFPKLKTKDLIGSDDRQYQAILNQYDMLIKEASYKGINLLNSQRLKINFNEDRSSGIEILGVSALSADLGIVAAEWQSKEDIEQSVSELEEAINTLRGYASQYGNYYSIVTTRQDFTENLINVLEEGADKLTLADMNQESANMLALQTSQQLAVNSLSLASQASQAVLRLF